VNEPRKIALVIGILIVLGLLAYGFELLSGAVGKWWLVLAWVSFAVLILLLGIHFARG
jgi:cytochrome c biogenesis protein CcdA